MVHKVTVQHFFDNQCAQLLQGLHDYCNTADSDALHTLRLMIKKLKSIVWLQNKCNKNQRFKSCIMPINKLFATLGSIRHAQLSQQFYTTHMPHCSILIQHQEKIAKKNFEELLIALPCYAKEVNKAAGILQHLAKKMGRKEAKKIARKHSSNIIECLRTTPLQTQNAWHAQRKKIQSLLYIHQFLYEHTNSKMLHHTKLWDKLQDIIGKWHDLGNFDAQLPPLCKATIKEFFMAKKLSEHLRAIEKLSEKLLQHYR